MSSPNGNPPAGNSAPFIPAESGRGLHLAKDASISLLAPQSPLRDPTIRDDNTGARFPQCRGREGPVISLCAFAIYDATITGYLLIERNRSTCEFPGDCSRWITHKLRSFRDTAAREYEHPTLSGIFPDFHMAKSRPSGFRRKRRTRKGPGKTPDISEWARYGECQWYRRVIQSYWFGERAHCRPTRPHGPSFSFLNVS